MTLSLSDKLMKARCRLITREPWYGHIAMSMTWIALPDGAHCQTIGVRIVNGGDVQCVYHPSFVKNLSLEELYAVVQHEIEHIVRLHCIRVDSRHPLAWNIAADMCVNGGKDNPRIGYKDVVLNRTIIPNMDSLVWIPCDWPNDETTEQYYDRIVKKTDKNSTLDDGEMKADGANALNGFGRLLDDHEIWNNTDLGMDEARQVVRDLVIQATDKCQGNVPSHLAQAIDKLNKPIIKWRQLLQHYLGKHVGNRRLTFSRRNRRRDQFGMPGVSRHAAATVNVIVDTSGSISTAELQQFFSEIESISSKAKTSILLWDHAFQGWSVYRRGDWKRIAIKGRGGTDMAAPLKWLMDNRKVADVQVMLTDGFCKYLPKSEVTFPVITVITRNNILAPQYGHIVHMK